MRAADGIPIESAYGNIPGSVYFGIYPLRGEARVRDEQGRRIVRSPVIRRCCIRQR